LIGDEDDDRRAAAGGGGGRSVVGRIIRIGWVADYFSRSALVGYLHGVAIVLVTGQLGKLFGIPSRPMTRCRS